MILIRTLLNFGKVLHDETSHSKHLKRLLTTIGESRNSAVVAPAPPPTQGNTPVATRADGTRGKQQEQQPPPQPQQRPAMVTRELTAHFQIFQKKSETVEDRRFELHENWARFAKIFRYQPMWKIRNYFGESNAFYFAWIGTFISSLWLPSFVGVLFFVIGVSKYR